MAKVNAPTPVPKVDEQQTVRLLMDLMAIPGPSGREGAVVKNIVLRLRSAGLPASAVTLDDAYKRSPRGGEIGNLIVKLPGTVRRPRRLLAAHLDTVDLCVGCKPVRRGGKIVSADPNTGLGADDRAGVAATLHAALTILKHKLPHPPLTFLWTVQEEVGLYGARFVTLGKLGRPTMGFNWDGDTGLTVGATGGYAIRIEITGIAAHAGGAPRKGASAIAAAGLAIADLHGNGWLGAVAKGRRKGTSNVGVIEAGTATNVVCPLARLHAEARSHDPAFRRQIVVAYRRAFERAARSVRNEQGKAARVDFQAQLQYESFRLKDTEAALATGRRVARRIGASEKIRTTDGGLDANWLVYHGIPTLTLGIGSHDVHTTRESADIPAFIESCRMALALATDVE